MVIVKWFGHACIGIIGEKNYVIVIDPHDGNSIGLEKPDIKANLVLVTHEHFDHNAVEAVSERGTRVLREFEGEVVIEDIKITGLKTYHDKYSGRRRGINIIYVIEVNGYKIAHLGDLGHIPGEEVLEKLKNLDLLAIPVGGTYTIYPDEAWNIVEQVKPRNVLPIHYWVEGVSLPLHPLDDFLMYVKKYRVIRLDTNEFELTDYDNTVIIPKITIKKRY